MGEEGDFHWADYLIFVASLVLTLDVGMYFAYTGRKKKTTDEFLLGSRNMHWIPVSLSLTVSYVSAITILGLTAESHYFGSMSSVLGLGFLLGGILVIAVYIPVLHRMKVTSCHEVCTGNIGLIIRTWFGNVRVISIELCFLSSNNVNRVMRGKIGDHLRNLRSAYCLQECVSVLPFTILSF